MKTITREFDPETGRLIRETIIEDEAPLDSIGEIDRWMGEPPIVHHVHVNTNTLNDGHKLADVIHLSERLRPPSWS